MRGEIINPAFDYASLDQPVAERARAAAELVRSRHQRVTASIIEIGQALLDTKQHFAHGQFTAWLQSEFGWTDRTAQNYMRAAQVFGERAETVSVLPPTAIYALAAPTTPETTREEVVGLIESGERIDPSDIRLRISAAREAEKREKAEAKKTPEAKAREKRRRERQREESEKLRRQIEDQGARRAEALEHAVAFLERKIGPDIPELAELLEAAGYHALAWRLKGYSAGGAP